MLALLSIPVILAACILPFMTYTDPSQGPTSIFNVGYAGGLWYAAEPVAVMMFSLIAAIMVIVLTNRTAQAALSAALVAFGAQTFFMFVGYFGGSVNVSGARLGPAGAIGAVGGLLLLAAGACAGISVMTLKTTERSAP